MVTPGAGRPPPPPSPGDVTAYSLGYLPHTVTAVFFICVCVSLLVTNCLLAAGFSVRVALIYFIVIN